MGMDKVEEEELKTVPPVEEESFDFGNNEEDDENDLFNEQGARENFEDEDEDESPEGEEQGEPVKVSDTSEEDEVYYKLAMGFVDSSRAMLLSMYASGDISDVSKYIYYENWDDPKHKAELEAGRVVARKWKFSTFKHLPEAVLVMTIIVSTLMLINQAKKDKKEQEGSQAPTEAPKREGKEVPIRKHRPLSKTP